MKKLLYTLLGATLFVGCADDDSVAPIESDVADDDKGAVDRAALEDGLTAALDGDLGTVEVPLAAPVPSAGDSDLKSAFTESVSLVIKNNTSGATVNLMSGSLVDKKPAKAGEFALAINSNRDIVGITFFNASNAGQSLGIDGKYSATLAISSNDYIDSLGTTAVDVAVKNKKK